MAAHILLVEDEVKLARFVELELSSEGYHTSVAHDGIEGLTLARESSPELVILDWMLPGLSGVEVCRRLRATGNKVPVIFLTAKDDVERRNNCLKRRIICPRLASTHKPYIIKLLGGFNPRISG